MATGNYLAFSPPPCHSHLDHLPYSCQWWRNSPLFILRPLPAESSRLPWAARRELVVKQRTGFRSARFSSQPWLPLQRRQHSCHSFRRKLTVTTNPLRGTMVEIEEEVEELRMLRHCTSPSLFTMSKLRYEKKNEKLFQMKKKIMKARQRLFRCFRIADGCMT